MSMRVHNARALLAAFFALFFLTPPAGAADFPEPLPAEPVPNVRTLPERYPQSWVFLNYASNRIELRNVGSDSRDVEGQLQARDSTTLLVPKNRPEIYTADTVWSRYTRGTRTDYITVYDTKTLNPIGEIVLPGAKRALITTMQGMFAFTDHERMGLVFDFTPASSVTVVDLIARKVLNSIDIPGCSLIYPTGARGFSTMCSSGTMLSLKLDAAGKVIGRRETRKFNDLDHDPLFTASAIVGGVRYFPSMHGIVQPVDLRGDEVKILPKWPLVGAADLPAHWRPAGWQIAAGEGNKLLYVLMQEHAHEGTHKDASSEVWVFNVDTKTRVRRLRLVRPGASIALTRGASPLLLVQADQRLDVYDPATGGLFRSLNLPGFSTRMLIQPVP